MSRSSTVVAGTPESLRRPAALRWAASVGAIIGLAAPAVAASTFSIDRTRVHLSQAQPSELVTLSNESSEPVRLQVTVQRWTQGPDEPVRLEPTEDVVFFPALMTIEPGRSRSIRVGLSRPPADRELTYRLIIDELPAPGGPGGTRLNVLTRLSVPVFVQPPKPEARPAVTSLLPSGDGLQVTVVNNGSAYAMIDTITVRGRDREAGTVGAASGAGWYVLAGSTQAFRITFDNPCQKAASFDVELTSGESVTRYSVPALGVCRE